MKNFVLKISFKRFENCPHFLYTNVIFYFLFEVSTFLFIEMNKIIIKIMVSIYLPSKSCSQCRHVVVGDCFNIETKFSVTSVAEGEQLTFFRHHGRVVLAAAHLFVE